MLASFSGKTADEVWQQAADMFRSGRSVEDSASRSGITHEILHATFRVEDPRQRWVSTRQPAMNPAFGLAEVVWIMAGRNDSGFLNYWNPSLPKYAGDGETYHGAYGYRLRHHLGFDQLERAYRALKAKPASRQVVLQIWDGSADMPREDGEPNSPDIPCNIVSLLKVRDNRLHWTQIIRSNDLILGVPHNFVQFMTLQEIMSGWLGVEPGPYVQWSDSLHVYSRDAETLQVPAGSAPVSNSESLMLPKGESDIVLGTLSEFMHKMTLPSANPSDIASDAKAISLPMAYKNLLIVVAADALRRHGAMALSTELMNHCSNPLYQQMWNNWALRMSNRDRNVAR